MKAIAWFITRGIFLCGVVFMPLHAFALGDLQAGQALMEKENAAPEEIIEKPQVQYTGMNYRDPFVGFMEEKSNSGVNVSASGNVPELPKLNLQGVIWGPVKPQVIIDNKVLNEGDVIQGVQILEIRKTGIGVIYSNRSYVIPTPAQAGKNEKE